MWPRPTCQPQQVQQVQLAAHMRGRAGLGLMRGQLAQNSRLFEAGVPNVNGALEGMGREDQKIGGWVQE